MNFPRYPEYKDSGVEWLGKVPAHWDVAPVGNRFLLRNGYPFKAELFSPEGKAYDRLIRIRDLLPTNSRLFTPESCPSWAAVTTGDVLIGMDGDFNVAYWDGGQAKLNQRVCAIRGSTVCWDKFIFYGVKRPLQIINDLTFSTTVKHLSSNQVLKMRFPIPPESEIEKIVAFLDYETTRIDALIEEQQRLIELLKEKREAVICHAVTQGLDPDVPMKNSGVEWLGAVPEHWRIERIADVFRQATDEGAEDLPVLRVSIHHGVSDKELSEAESDRKITRIEDRKKYKRVFPGDLVYNMMRAWQGGFGAVSVEGLVSPAYVVARPTDPDIRTDYVEYLLRTRFAVEEMRRLSYGITDFRLRLYWEQFRQIRIPLPSRDESELIISEINRLTDDFSALKKECEQQIALLTERRSALISAAVTGKIDVRNWVPHAKADEEPFAMAAEPRAVYETDSS